MRQAPSYVPRFATALHHGTLAWFTPRFLQGTFFEPLIGLQRGGPAGHLSADALLATLSSSLLVYYVGLPLFSHYFKIRH